MELILTGVAFARTAVKDLGPLRGLVKLLHAFHQIPADQQNEKHDDQAQSECSREFSKYVDEKCAAICFLAQ
jgi:hypothetical protein